MGGLAHTSEHLDQLGLHVYVFRCHHFGLRFGLHFGHPHFSYPYFHPLHILRLANTFKGQQQNLKGSVELTGIFWIDLTQDASTKDRVVLAWFTRDVFPKITSSIMKSIT